MSEPIWLDVDAIIDMHAEQLAIFGGPEAFATGGNLNPRSPVRSTNGTMAKAISRRSRQPMPLALPRTTLSST